MKTMLYKYQTGWASQLSQGVSHIFYMATRKIQKPEPHPLKIQQNWKEHK
jgi:hypothetical protein